MTEPSQLPLRRELPSPTAGRIRTRVLAGAAAPAPAPRRWLPLAAAVAVVALVAGAVAVTGRRPEPAPVTPATRVTTSATATIRPADIPSVAQVVDRCGISLMYPSFRYVTRYVGDGAVTWLFASDAKNSTTVCTWKAGSTGLLASFANDWSPADGGMGPASDGKLHLTQDQMKPSVESGATLPPEYDQLEPDRQVLLGPVPARVTKVVVGGPDGDQVAASGAHWFLYHLRKPGVYRIDGYDSDGAFVDGLNLRVG